MPASGITIARKTQGQAQYVRIDLRKYGEQLKDFFRLNGIEIDNDASMTASQLQKDLQDAAEDVRLYKQGKLKLKTARDLLNEL